MVKFIRKHFVLFAAIINGTVFLISIFDIYVYKCNKFLFIDSVSCNFSEFVYQSYQFSCGICRCSIYTTSSANIDNFTSFFLIWVQQFISFPYLTVLSRISSTVFNKSSENGHLSLRGTVF